MLSAMENTAVQSAAGRRVSAVADDRVHRAVQQLAYKEIVEPGADDPELEALRVEIPFKNRSGTFAVAHP